MAADRAKQFWMENLFRPVFELRLAQIWLLGGLFTIIAGGLAFDTQVPAHLLVGGVMIAISIVRFREGLPLLKRQFRL
ncbi:hypothetical protein QTO17_42175, partial [Vibrio owensii]